MAWDTAANIINDAAVELGLISSDISNPFASTDPNILQLCRLAKGLGQDLLRDYPWTHLQKEATITTSNGDYQYDLPTDFARVVDNTHWSRTDSQSLNGPVGPAGWQYLKGSSVSSTLSYWFRTVNDEIQLHPTPTATETLKYEYISRYWVKPSGQSTPTAETTTAGTDTLYFDRRLLVIGLQLMYRGRKGLDTMMADPEFKGAYARATGGDGAAPVLRLTRSGVCPPYGPGVPETGFGS